MSRSTLRSLRGGSLALLFVCGATTAAHAATTPTDSFPEETLPPELSTLKNRPEIPYDPFAMVDPATGKPIGANEILELPRGLVTAGEYYANLNEYQKKLNKLGYSLKNAADLGVIQRLNVNELLLDQHAKVIDASVATFDSKVMLTQKTHDEMKKRLEARLKGVEDRAIDELRGFAESSGVEVPKLTLPKIDDKVMRNVNSKLASVAHKEWNFVEGKEDTFQAKGSAVFHIGAGTEGGQILANAYLGGSVLGQRFDLIYGYAEFSTAMDYDVTTKRSKATATATGEAYLNVLGTERYRYPDKTASKSFTVRGPGWPWADDKEEKKAAPAASDAQVRSVVDAALADSPAPSAAADPPAAEAPSKDTPSKKSFLPTAPWSWAITTEKKWFFMVGPVPCSASVGVKGSLDLGWGSNLAATSAGAFLQGSASTAIWAEGGFDAVIVSAGINANLVFVRDVVRLQGDAILTHADLSDLDLEKAKKLSLERLQPKLTLAVSATNTMSALEGSVSAFVEAYVPKVGIPPYEQKRWSHEFFNWKGFQKTGVLWSWKKEYDPFGVKVTGAPTEADLESVRLDEALKRRFESALAGLDEKVTRDSANAQAELTALAAAKAKVISVVGTL
jgi:hypothetical protein